MLIKKKVAFLFDKNNTWLIKYIPLLKTLPKIKYKYNFLKSYKKINNYEIVFVLGYTRILPESFIKKNHVVLIVHESNLPKYRGFAPVQWQILNNKKKITNSLILLGKNEKVDLGKVILQNLISLQGDELYDEIRENQFNSTYKLIKKFLNNYPNFKTKKQKGKSSFFRKRAPKDSEININKSLKSQFNLLRIANNEEWPAFFFIKIINIF